MRCPTLAAVALASLALVGCTSATRLEPEPEPEAVAIPLAAIHSTNCQEGLVAVKQQTPGYAYDYDQIIRVNHSGASNIFLATGDDFDQAMNATRSVFGGCCPVDVPVNRNRIGPQPLSYWLTAFLGVNGSGPPAWLVRSAERKGRVIRLSVFRPYRESTTKDSHQYFVWVPLGKLEAGRYVLELYDSGTKEVTLTRRVTVTAR